MATSKVFPLTADEKKFIAGIRRRAKCKGKREVSLKTLKRRIEKIDQALLDTYDLIDAQEAADEAEQAMLDLKEEIKADEEEERRRRRERDREDDD